MNTKQFSPSLSDGCTIGGGVLMVGSEVEEGGAGYDPFQVKLKHHVLP